MEQNAFLTCSWSFSDLIYTRTIRVKIGKTIFRFGNPQEKLENVVAIEQNFRAKHCPMCRCKPRSMSSIVSQRE